MRSSENHFLYQRNYVYTSTYWPDEEDNTRRLLILRWLLVQVEEDTLKGLWEIPWWTLLFLPLCLYDTASPLDPLYNQQRKSPTNPVTHQTDLIPL